jgi:hypothetical protein
MQIQLRPHVSPEKTPWGTVGKSLNQDIVLIQNQDTGEFVQCGYVGDTHFLPLAGFPQELCDSVAAECSKKLGKPVSAGMAPPSLEELTEFLNSKADEGEDE